MNQVKAIILRALWGFMEKVELFLPKLLAMVSILLLGLLVA